MTDSKTYINIFNFFVKPKPVGKCHNMIFNFLKNLMTYLEKGYWIFFSQFIFHICAKFQTKKKVLVMHDMCISMFSITFTFWKELREFLHMMSVLTIFGEGNFICSFVSYGLVTKSLGARAHFRRWWRKQNVKKWMWILL